MKANELRIGNIINSDIIATVITQENIEWATFNAEMFTGVPLTEEWLLKFGFKFKNLGNFFFKYGGELQYQVVIRQHKRYFSGEHLSFSCDITSHDIKYVHQLQNLYFALTSEELETTK